MDRQTLLQDFLMRRLLVIPAFAFSIVKMAELLVRVT